MQELLFNEAKQYIPGGVNSPVRAFNAVKSTPHFIKSADGAYIIDEDNNRYIDYVLSWGPMILGHNNQKVKDALKKQIDNGLSFGAPTILETKIAKKIVEIINHIEQVRLVSSGTEATMTAIRIMRGFTGRNKIIKFEGCYHGHSDALLVSAGSGALTFGEPSSKGVPKSFTEHTLVANFNDLASVEKWFSQFPDDVAGIIVEPIPGNMNLIKPKREFLTGLRDLCNKYNALLTFDEVMSGFRVSLGGASEIFDITPDITTYGKIVGGGMPLGAIGSTKKIMSCLSPLGGVYQAGTLSGNPIAVCAGLTTLNEITNSKDLYQNLAKNTEYLVESLIQAAKAANVKFFAQNIGSMFGFYFTDKTEITNFSDVASCNQEQFIKFFQGMLKGGVYLAPSAYEAGFVSIKHDKNIIDKTVEVAKGVFKTL